MSDINNQKLKINGLPDQWVFPTTRYRGSKRKILPWVWQNLKEIDFDTCLDLFGGTSTVSLLFKRMGKKVTTNDYLKYNYLTSVAFIENQATKFESDDIEFVLKRNLESSKEKFISKTFSGYYFTDTENNWLDTIIPNILALSSKYEGELLKQKQAIAFWALGQACLIKRPFNLFHRKNLLIRTSDVERKFGNKTTWEKPFDEAFLKFIHEANSSIFDNGRNNIALRQNAFSMDVVAHYDLVYLDPPYFFEKQRDVDYHSLYHFLDGIVSYEKWPELLDYNSYNLRLKDNGFKWPKSEFDLTNQFESLINKFSASVIVISHKSGSLVPVERLVYILEKQGKTVTNEYKPYNYALSKRNGQPQHNSEWLIIGK